MKKLISLFGLGLLLASCGSETAPSTTDLNGLKAQKSKLMEQQNKLALELDAIEESIKAIEMAETAEGELKGKLFLVAQ